MDNRPIGVFDSGLGGLTAVRQLQRLLPGEEIVYFGDTGRVPYGGRSRETVIRYARQDIAFLQSYDIKAIVVACGTVSSVALPTLIPETETPMIGVVEPACQKAARLTRNGRIGVIGTAGTIASRSYEYTLQNLRPGLRVVAKACPLFVPLVENGRFQPGDRVAELVVEEYLDQMRQDGVDTLILGCTHYPLLREIIAAFLGPGVQLISPGEEAAGQTLELLRRDKLLSDRQKPGRARYFVSDAPESFAAFAGMFMGAPVAGDVALVDIGQYGNEERGR